MVYVALTVATFSATTMCCVWFFKERLWNSKKYNSLEADEEQIELQTHHSSSDDEVDIPLDLTEEEPPEAKLGGVFTIEDDNSDDEQHDDEQHEPYEEEQATNV